jgi:RimJ/RimL family protein N-acetyltransferase
MDESGAVGLRPVREADLEVFYIQQREPEAVSMAAFPARDRAAFFTHWQTRVLTNPDGQAMTITYEDSVAGNVVSWATDDRVLIGYWLGSDYWGKGIATAALRMFLAGHERRRPLHAQVVSTNAGSIRVLEKCGFEPVERSTEFDETSGRDVEELLMVYR